MNKHGEVFRSASPNGAKRRRFCRRTRGRSTSQPRARPIRGVMAKVGEGDERWIVKERADGQNCNNWHWTTKDVSGHTKKVLRAVPRASQRLEP